MNIALAPTSYFPRSSGVSVAVRNLARAFVQKGHAVVIITPRLNESQPSYEILDGIEIHRMRFVLPWRLLWQNPDEGFFRFLLHGPVVVRRLVHLIRQKRIEVINVHHFGPQLPYLLFAQLFTEAQAVLTLHGTELFRLHPSSDRMRRSLGMYSLRRAKSIVAFSSHTADEIARVCPEASGKTVKISNGVAVDEFCGADRHSFRPPYVLSLSRLNPLKGHDLLLAAFRKVAQLENDVHLVIAADGPQRIRLQALAMSLGLKGRVTFLGQVGRDRVRELLAGCEFLVNCSWIEGIPNAVLEAMASGKAVVGMRVGGVPEVVSDLETGRLVRSGDPDHLAETILSLLQDRDSCRAMGQRGRAFVEANHDLAQSVDRYLEVFGRALLPADDGRRHIAKTPDP